MKVEIWRLTKTARLLRYSEAAGIARFQVAKSGNFREYADSERKASQETFGRTQTQRGKPFRKLSRGCRLGEESLSKNFRARVR